MAIRMSKYINMNQVVLFLLTVSRFHTCPSEFIDDLNSFMTEAVIT